MPNWEPGHCINHDIHHDRKGTPWYGRDSQHCFHGLRCCWCGLRVEPNMTESGIMEHGKFAPRKKRRKLVAVEVPSDIEPELHK